MYHMKCTQTIRQHGGFSVRFISREIELCDVSKVVLHSAATVLLIKSLFERIHFISLTAAYVVKTSFKFKGMLHGIQRPPGQPFLTKHEIRVLTWVLKPLVEHPLSIVIPCYVILSESFTHCGHFCHATSFRASGLCSITLSKWFIVILFTVVLSEWFMLFHPEWVIRAPSSEVSGSSSIILSEWFMLCHPE